jgi:hypothetical protein
MEALGLHPRRFALVACLTTLAGPVFNVVSAQSKTATFVIVGVADAETGQALIGVQVVFPALSRVAQTDALGEARLSIPSGTHRVRVRFLGYAAADTSLSLTGDTTGIVFRLPRVPTTLETVDVKASMPANLKEFEMRRNLGLGRFLTKEDLAKDASRPFGIVAMTRFPGLQLVTDADGRPHIASVRGTCGATISPSEGILAGARGGGSGGRGASTTGGTPTGVQGSGGAGSGQGAGTSGASGATQLSLGSCNMGRQCYVVTFLDNIELDSADFDLITTWDIAGVEYYSGNSVPARYRVNGAACGVMLVWSK